MKNDDDLDDILMIEATMQLTEKEKQLLARMRDIARTLNLPGAPSPNIQNLILCWLTRKLPADLSDEHISHRIKEAFYQAQNFGGISRQRIWPAAIYARRAFRR
jgi:hypothetical protein